MMKFSGVATAILGWMILLGCQPSNRPQPEQTPIETVVESKGGDETTSADANEKIQWKRQIATVVSQRDADSLSKIARQVMLSPAADAELYESLGEAWQVMGNPGKAIEMFDAALEVADEPTADLFEKTGHAYMAVGRTFDTIELMKRCVKQHPDDAKRRVDLVGLMIAQALERDAMVHLQHLIQRGQAGISELVIASDASRPQADEQMSEQALKLNPSDLRPKYALTRFDAYKHRWQVVKDGLIPVVQKHPDFTPAWAYLTRAAVETNDRETLAKISSRAFNADYESHPQVWIARGVWANRNGDSDLASAAFAEAVRLDPNHHEALTKLTTALAKSGDLQLSQKVSVRAGQVNELRDAVDGFLGWRRNSQRLAMIVAEKLQQLGRQWEAVVWLRAAFTLPQDPAENVKQAYLDARAKLTSNTPWQTFDGEWLPESNETKAMLAKAKESGWFMKTSAGSGESSIAADSNPKRQPPKQPVAQRGYRLEDEANQRGLVHTVGLNRPRSKDGLWLWQSGLGGAGVLDFDLDGWPDLHLTSAGGVEGGLPGDRNGTPNTTVRNVRGHYVDVSEATGLADPGYTQGVGVGDFNADGFPDCLIANIGFNTLYLNNGDGTFADVTTWMLKQPERYVDDTGKSIVQVGTDSRHTWTSSTAIADVDHDGLSDLIEVNYCGGPTPYQQRCMDETAREYRSCQPISFPAERDRVHRNRGVISGGELFEDRSADWLQRCDPGRGLGVLVGQLDGTLGLDIYVSNDMTANHFWHFDPLSGSLQEQATIRGVAFNHQSAAEASMGIAAADADGDLDLDLYLTHFTDESNTFYEQTRPGLFEDKTEANRLGESSRDMLGFGTQFVDLDGDRVDELVVANGHIDDFSHDGLRYEMPAQLLALNPENHWEWVAGDSVGPHFDESRMGRAMAILDADRDGRNDLVVTDLFRPTALLMNRTPQQSVSLQVRVVGTRSERDAIGTTVIAKTSAGKQMRQRMAGSGYQCSNESLLTFAIPDGDPDIELDVVWPSGLEQSVRVSANERELLLIEPLTGE
ncbi:FG-GAP-like repeat-containing protein [Rhodopirellula halodulae]|uniref:FG-GAP-like repeat-containing protein n=1 Tax=Rhodopirellula halodulae TaxID=2894198 RepID=UPI001E493EEA|nr:FG-GAP-like repeat-containing protein [Rhodopirellula sp. JC737]MCC9656975.1 FG-GAP-like repeat-containing protein [Rhodopirellula sp. JC737]